MGPVTVIIDLFLQYVFRPLDHFLFSKDRYSSRFAVLAPVTKYFSSCRLALCNHSLYPWPSAPAWSFMIYCSKCASPSAFWCVECDTRYCAGCAARYHHPGLYAQHHSVEPLEGKQVRLLGLVMSNLLVILSAFYVASSIQIAPNYLTSADLCPVTSQVRAVAAGLDSKVFYYYKAELVGYCNMEDSFYKFFLDGWVRGIVTTSDDTLLVLTSAAPAYVMTTVLSILLVPIVAFFYGLIMAVTHFIDSLLPKSSGLEQAEQFLQRFDLCTFFGGQSAAPPPTKWRLKPAMDFFDHLKYAKNRRTRFYSYYYAAARDALTYWVNRAVPWFMAFRLLLIWCPGNLGAVLQNLLSYIMGSTIAEQQLWFTDTVSNMLFSDNVSSRLLSNSMGYAHHVFSLLPFVDAVNQLLFYSVLAASCLLAGFIGFLLVITHQQRRYYSEFDAGEVVGCCPNQESCSCESIKFMVAKALEGK